MFNDNQLFYAALWWVAGLPGGAKHVPAILDRYGMAPVDFPPCAITRGRKKANWFTMSMEELLELEDWEARGYNPADEILPPEKLDAFFDCLFAAVRQTAQEKTGLCYTFSGRDRYLELRQSGGTSTSHPAWPDFPFSDALEAAIAIAGISRHALPRKRGLYAHEDGQLFVPARRDRCGIRFRRIIPAGRFRRTAASILFHPTWINTRL